jgi:hypothetical protein
VTDLSLLLYSSRTCRCPWQLFSDPVLWSRRLGKKIRLVPCAINFVRGQLREPTAPLLKVDSNHVWHAWQVEHNGWIQHNSSVRVCCQTKVVHPACSYEALIFGFHRELLISPSLASTWRPLNKFFDPIYTISVSKSSGLLSRLPRLCIDNSFLIIF